MSPSVGASPGRPGAAGNESTFVGLSIPRQLRFSARKAESSARQRLTSPSLAPLLSEAAAAIASRAIGRARGNRRQRGDGTLMSRDSFIWPGPAAPLYPRFHRPPQSDARDHG